MGNKVDEQKIADGLYELTRTLSNVVPKERLGGGLLGGEFGYGADYENETFFMQPYCWCEQPTCLWCLSCTCPDDVFSYFLADGTEVDDETFYENGGYSKNTVKIDHTKKCVLCKEIITSLPNFFHKPTGTKIWWYKYIGRSMEIELTGNWETIITDCQNSLLQPSLIVESPRR